MKDRARILIIGPTPPPVAGVEVVTRILLDSPLREEFELVHLKSNVRRSNLKKGRWDAGGVLRVVRLWLRLVRLLTVRPPAAVYTPLSQNATGFLRDALFIWTAAAFGKPVVAHLQGGLFPLFAENAPAPLRGFIRSTLRRLALVILQARKFLPRMKSWAREGSLRVVYNGIPRPPANPVPARDGRMVLFLSLLSASKGFHTLLEAVPEITRRAPGARFVCVGDRIEDEKNVLWAEDGRQVTPPPADLRKVLAGLPRVETQGQIFGEEKWRLYREAAVFVLPSFSESHPLVVMEAMAAGCPLVVTPVGALSEILEEGTHALFVPAGRPDRLAEAVSRLLADEGLRLRMGEANRKRLLEFTDGRFAVNMSVVFREAMGCAAGRTPFGHASSLPASGDGAVKSREEVSA